MLEDSNFCVVLHLPEEIPSPICVSPRLLRNRIGSARVYIRPIQKDLNLEPDDIGHNDDEVTEKCLKCQIVIPVSELRSHLQSCYTTVSESDDDSVGKGGGKAWIVEGIIISNEKTEQTLVDPTLEAGYISDDDLPVISFLRNISSLTDIASNLASLSVEHQEV